jgi:3-oxoacyl-[acyl-carrier protein] reductase
LDDTSNGTQIEMNLTNKVAIVTGGSRGIGRATAECLARAGAKVVVNFLIGKTEADRTVETIEKSGGVALAVQADVGVMPDIERLFTETIERFGCLDILVANAGYSSFAPLAEFTEAEFDKTYAINTKGTFFCLQQAAKHIADDGRIICVSTIGTLLNMPGGACYFGSKAAVEQYCRVLAKELAPRRITVNAISPGFTDTDMLAATGGTDPIAAGQIKDMTPLGRFGRPDEIANAICFLASPEGGWVNRQNLAVDGGIVSR